MKQQAICSKCLQSVDRILALECSHSLCLLCASRVLQRLQKSRNRITNLECEVCGVVSYLHPSAYDELLTMEQKRGTPIKDNSIRVEHHLHPSDLKPPTRLDLSISDGPLMLFCFTCQTPCFTVDEYISGLHRNHSVGNTTKQESIFALKELLSEVNEQVRKRIEVALRQSTKLTQRKRELIEQMGRTKTGIRGTFEKIREEVTNKQTEVIGELEGWMAKKFGVVDGAIQDIKIFTEKCEMVEDSIRCYQQAVIQADVVKGFNYYAEKKTLILSQIAEPIERITEKAITSATNLSTSYDSLLEILDQLKKTKLVIKNNEKSLQPPKDNYFQSIRQEIFSQDTRREQQKPPFMSSQNISLSRVRSVENIRHNENSQIFEEKVGNTTKKRPAERECLQSRLQDKIKGLENLLQRKSRQPIRLHKRNILNLS